MASLLCSHPAVLSLRQEKPWDLSRSHALGNTAACPLALSPWVTSLLWGRARQLASLSAPSRCSCLPRPLPFPVPTLGLPSSSSSLTAAVLPFSVVWLTEPGSPASQCAGGCRGFPFFRSLSSMWTRGGGQGGQKRQDGDAAPSSDQIDGQNPITTVCEGSLKKKCSGSS